MKALFGLFLIAAVTAGCKNTKSTVEEPAAEPRPSATMTERTNSTARPIRTMELAEFDAGDPFIIQGVDVKGDIISLVVTYSGGCKDHGFVLFADPRIMKSMPPQQNILLKHDANEDHCRALVTDTLRFDLSPIRIGNEGSIVLRMHNNDDRITYTYR